VMEHGFTFETMWIAKTVWCGVVNIQIPSKT